MYNIDEIINSTVQEKIVIKLKDKKEINSTKTKSQKLLNKIEREEYIDSSKYDTIFISKKTSIEPKNQSSINDVD